jgi:hypothetical protein
MAWWSPAPKGLAAPIIAGPALGAPSGTRRDRDSSLTGSGDIAKRYTGPFRVADSGFTAPAGLPHALAR